MLEWRSDQNVYGGGYNNGNTSENYLREDRPEAESKAQEELNQATQPKRAKAGNKIALLNFYGN